MSSFSQLLGQLLNTLQPTSVPSTPTPPVAPPWYWRDNPDDMFTPAQNLARNQQWTLPGPYQTRLSPTEEQQFQQWLRQQPNIKDPGEYLRPDASYDMRGFWKAMMAGNPNAASSVNPDDLTVHYPDIWKTPYEATFSKQSIYAMPTAPDWVRDYRGNWRYVMPSGQVIFDSPAGKWYGVPSQGQTK